VLAACADRAHAQARGGEVPREDVGLYVATGMVDAALEDLAPAILASRDGAGRLDVARFFAAGFRAIHPLWPLAMLNNVAVGQVAADLDVRGDNLVFACEADAGVRAFQEALAALEEGAVRLALVGGVAEPVSPASLARRRLRGQGAPPGEGGAVVALEHPDSARGRGVRVLGWVAAAALASGEGALAAAERAATEAAGAGAPVGGPCAFPPVVLVGDLGVAAPAVGIAALAGLWSHVIRGAREKPAPRLCVGGVGSGGAAGAIVFEPAPTIAESPSATGARA
jgi:3-oxoacyl-(acyl-carrier-protein) synthase